MWEPSQSRFQTIIWTLCGVSTVFLASRVAIRITTKGRLMVNDYFVIGSLPLVLISSGLLHSALPALYEHPKPDTRFHEGSVAPRLTAAFELLWISIYFVKFCFLSQFKFHKPPYAYVSVHLTRYYWAVFGICGLSFLFTVSQPIIVCLSSETCSYLGAMDAIAWEIAVTAADIASGIMVISIPIVLVYMANFNKSHAIINASFKSLNIFAIAAAVARMCLQYNSGSHLVRYVQVALSLVIEASIAIIMASISSYRSIILDAISERKRKHSKDNDSQRQFGLAMLMSPLDAPDTIRQ